jgi:hypothetical protein
VIHNVESSEPQWNCSVQNGRQAFYLLDPKISEMLERKSFRIQDKIDPGYLSFLLSADHFQEREGSGQKLIWGDGCRVPGTWEYQVRLGQLRLVLDNERLD